MTVMKGLLGALLAVQQEAPTLRKDATNPVRDRYRNPLDACPDCGALKLQRARRCKSCSCRARVGEERTSTPANSTGWARARRTRPVGPCEFPGCTQLGTDRHHIDADPTHNDPSNIAVYCRRHHMHVDGRLDALAAQAHAAGQLGGRPLGITPACDEAAAFLEEQLRSGPLPASVVRDRAKVAGHSWRTLAVAKRRLSVRSRRLTNYWEWELPK